MDGDNCGLGARAPERLRQVPLSQQSRGIWSDLQPGANLEGVSEQLSRSRTCRSSHLSEFFGGLKNRYGVPRKYARYGSGDATEARSCDYDIETKRVGGFCRLGTCLLALIAMRGRLRQVSHHFIIFLVENSGRSHL